MISSSRITSFVIAGFILFITVSIIFIILIAPLQEENDNYKKENERLLKENEKFIQKQNEYRIELQKVSDKKEKEFAQDLFIFANIERKNDLIWDDCLAEQAQNKAKVLLQRDEFTHDLSNGKNPWYFVEKCYDYEHAGENLAEEFVYSQNAHNALMNSPLHRANIKNENYTHIGVACYNGRVSILERDYICVQLFAEPVK